MISLIIYRGFCQSNIGKTGGKQLLSLGAGCKNRGHVTHELMHALGFFHEHTRPDRDKFVRILWDNIKSGNVYSHSDSTPNECICIRQCLPVVRYPGYQRFFLVCDGELCCLRHFEDSKPETAHEKPLAPRVVVRQNLSLFFLLLQTT